MPYARLEGLEEPAADAPILRYMTFEKFVWLLEYQALFFTRVDLLGDPLEGSMSGGNIEARRVGDARIFAKSEQMQRDIEMVRRRLPRSVFVNCWTLSGYESPAMWQMYVGDSSGIAIQSTFGRLRTQLKRSGMMFMFAGKLNYVDFDRDFIPEANALAPFIHKRRAFEYEKEVRVLTSSMFDPFFDHDLSPPEGLVYPIDVARLVLRVRVSPLAPAWFLELVQRVITSRGLRFKAVRSDIPREPVF